MAILITDPDLEERLLAQRREWGGDRHDEVWDGVYVMSPIANNEHQELITRLSTVFDVAVGMTGLGRVLAGANVTDRADDWTKNYRVPDVLVFLNGTKAEDRGTHWLGGPDLAVEVVSRGDRSREKLAFYAAVGTRELLVVARDPWALELYRLRDGVLDCVGVSTVEAPEILASEVVPLTFRLRPGERRPEIDVGHRHGGQRWVV